MRYSTIAAVTLLVAVAVIVPWASPVPAADDPPPDAVRVEAVIVPAGKRQRLQTKSKLPIRQMVNSKEKVVQVLPYQLEPSRVWLEAKEAGTSRLTLVDVKGGREVLVIVVE